MCRVTWNRFPIKKLAEWLVEISYLKTDMCKSASSQSHKSRVYSVDSLKACSKPEFLITRSSEEKNYVRRRNAPTKVFIHCPQEYKEALTLNFDCKSLVESRIRLTSRKAANKHVVPKTVSLHSLLCSGFVIFKKTLFPTSYMSMPPSSIDLLSTPS